MEGTLQLVVNLRSPSVEYSAEVGENRYGRTLRSDKYTPESMIALAKTDSDFAGMEDRMILEQAYAGLSSLVGSLGSLTSFTIQRGGNECVIRADDISFITLETTGIFRRIADESK